MNKLLVLVYVPILEKEYDVYIPVNKKIGTIKDAIINCILEDNYKEIGKFNNLKLYDKDTTVLYDNNVFVKESGIINGSKLILM